MPSNLPRFTIRTEQINIDKISFIAEKESRTTTKQIEYLIKRYIDEYEDKHGELIIEEDGTVHPKIKLTNDNSKVKSSTYKAG